jgi:hypothetical protein
VPPRGEALRGPADAMLGDASSVRCAVLPCQCGASCCNATATQGLAAPWLRADRTRFAGAGRRLAIQDLAVAESGSWVRNRALSAVEERVQSVAVREWEPLFHNRDL